MCNSQPSRHHNAWLLLGLAIVISGFFWPVQEPLSLCAAEPNDPTAERDEKIYGKFAIGPRTSTALDAAVVALNVKLSEFAELYRRQSEQVRREDPPIFKPLTPEEVVAAINYWDREKFSVADATYRLYTEIAKTRNPAPPFAFRDRRPMAASWEPCDSHVSNPAGRQ